MSKVNIIYLKHLIAELQDPTSDLYQITIRTSKHTPNELINLYQEKINEIRASLKELSGDGRKHKSRKMRKGKKAKKSRRHRRR